MGLILHELLGSPPVRAVKLCLNELGLKAEYKTCNILAGENLTPEFNKLNPQHTVPVLEDGDFIIWESHAINGYLISKYGSNESLYPKQAEIRALIDQRLHFDTGVLFPALKNIAKKLFYLKLKTFPEEDKQAARDALAFVEKFLEERKFITGNSYNIADFSIYTSVTTLLVFVPEIEKYPNLKNYLERCRRSFKGIKDDDLGLQALEDLYKSAVA